MSTWHICKDVGGNFRWESSGKILQNKPQNEQPHKPTLPPLPSMADLLYQGCSKLVDNRDEDEGIFRTGLGRSVAIKQSSIDKAFAVLGSYDEDCDYNFDAISSGKTQARENEHGFTNSLFRTASGKPVDVSSAGLVRAKTLLGLEISNDGNKGFQLPRKSSISEQNQLQNLPKSSMEKSVKNHAMHDALPVLRPSSLSRTSLNGHRLSTAGNSNMMDSEVCNSTPKPPSIKFHTAGGRSLSVSSDALERAKRILGDPDIGTFLNEDLVDPTLSGLKENRIGDALSTKKAHFHSAFTYPGAAKSKHISKSFISPLKSSLHQDEAVQSFSNAEKNVLAVSLLKKFDAADDNKSHGSNGTTSSMQKLLPNSPSERNALVDNSLAYGNGSMVNSLSRSSNGPLVDISNTVGNNYINHNHSNGERKRLGRRTSTPPFKRPRSSKFTTPYNRNVAYAPSGLSSSSSESSCRRHTVSTRYPFQCPRMYIKEFFKELHLDKSMLEHITDQVRCIKPVTAENYTFCDESGASCIGSEAFQQMLVLSGASVQFASKEWVINHYKWIVWKLACYERFCQLKFAKRFLTVSNVLEELKYRYEREVNHGHRSAIKRILEGDSPPSSMLVLCISAIDISCKTNIETRALNGSDCSNGGRVELTDGWYSVGAVLDVPLSKQLAAGKLFVGQKLRIWGAALCGWGGPVSPLELLASRTASLLLHVNGTYRSHWADRLGFCKNVIPLAFRCIKSNGGLIPQTLVGVTRIYPVLYKEKLSNGGSIVRSERMESKAMHMFNQRKSALIEGIISEFQREMKGSHVYNDSDSEEGAKIMKVLEAASEPEVLMAGMSLEQLTSFASYQAKLEANKQLDMEKAIEKALTDAGLSEREVTPFMRVRVVGLSTYPKKGGVKEGLLTIWNPTEKQQSELVEGQSYAVAGLLPVNSDSYMLYLQARGSTTKWQPLSTLATQSFQPFFSPRVSVSLSNLGEVPLSNEFDTAAYVVHVGEVYASAHSKKQWVFVTDSSISTSKSEEISNSLLAISFCSPYVNDDSFTPINCNLVGTTVGFINLIKKAKDQMNHVWTAEATENSTYLLSFDSLKCSHLKSAATAVQTWAKTSSMIVDKLKAKILFIVGNRKG
ncbi:protein BREAST CANCER SUSCEPTIBILITY 2 homolog B isoform X2 [Mercurialis annua]|uniref:protein BREAST CANCER SUSCEPTIBILITY 2 homolog B isoform X2 n=1 Tax=Mercurialis annua TaxID=3986 RepID=UPI002160B5EA|nr:protein BREAST CANCER SUSCEPTIBILITY 2 homolog B isoform X2 [Mercurialis annua]